jgi:thiamine pyrophosphate-dependent acetolactate synthase large subunit-like protein
MTVRMTGGEALARALGPENVPFVFGVAGGKLLRFMHALSQQQAIRYVGVRHEASASMMAAATYAASGRMAVAMGEVGPGAINLLAGMGNAYNNNLAVFALTSNNQLAASYPARGLFMGMDTRAMFAPVTKWNAVVQDGERIPELVRTAFREALSRGRPGPVHLDVPQNVLVSSYDFDEADFETTPDRYRAMLVPRASAEAISRAAELLNNARRPLLVAGGGVARARAETEFRRLAERLGAPATATQMGLGSVSTDSPAFFGHGGVIGGPAIPDAFARADVILAVGCRFSSWLWNQDGPLPNKDAQLIEINIDAADIGRTKARSVGIIADARSGLIDLDAALAAARYEKSADPEWVHELTQLYAQYRANLQTISEADDDPVMHPAALATEIAAHLPRDVLVTYDGGHTTFWSNDLTPAYEPRTRFHDPGMSQLGFGTPWALALQLLYPGRPVVNIIGDGAFGFTLTELDTARRYQLPVVSIIHNNGAWGVIRAGQRRALDFELGTDLEGTDYAAIARGFGAHAETVTRLDEIGPAMKRAFAAKAPAVLDCRTRFVPHPCLPQFGAMSGFGLRVGNLLHAAAPGAKERS